MIIFFFDFALSHSVVKSEFIKNVYDFIRSSLRQELNVILESGRTFYDRRV